VPDNARALERLGAVPRAQPTSPAFRSSSSIAGSAATHGSGSVIKAQSEDVPEELLAFFRSDDPARDSDRFQALLEEWYQDPESDQWYASWNGFVFPEAPRFGATFIGDAHFRAATFAGDASFTDATFTGDADFESATFRGNVYFASSTFSANLNFRRATVSGDAYFSSVTFTGNGDFSNATFTGDADFSQTTFTGDAYFEGATFSGNAYFGGTTFSGNAYFGSPFGSATFSRDAAFGGATFSGTAMFARTTFTGDVQFLSGTFTEDAIFGETTFTGKASFNQTTFAGHADFRHATFAHKSTFASLRMSSRSRLSLQGCSLAQVELHSLDLRSLGAGAIRLAGAADIEQLTLRGVKWPEKANRPRTADEFDLDLHDLLDFQRPSPEGVELVYRGLRKNHEDRGDRVGAHGWYFSEMEVGRSHAKLFSLKRVARGFYKATSNYGLSALRPAVWLGVAIAIALVLFSLGAGWCPTRLGVDPAARECVGLQDRVQVALLAIFLQAPPGGVVLSGVLGQIVWLVLRVTGAAMLFSIGIAFRNQVAR
jgi:hypothetical protein